MTGSTVTISGGSTGLTTTAATATMDLTGTLNVGHGGTGDTSFTAYAPVCGGTTSTAALQSATTGFATSGFVLTSTGSTSLPTFQAVSASGAITTIDGDSGSVTPTAGVVTISGGTTGLTTSGSGSTLNLTGTLNLTHGGTNASLTASNGGIFYSTSTAGAILSGTATADQVLLSGSSSAPSWSTATYPSTVSINNLLYASSANVISGLSTGNDGVLITSNTGVPSWLAAGTTGQILTATTGSPPSWESPATSVITIDGDSGSMTGSTVTISGGTTGLTTSASGSTMDLTGTLKLANGGTNASLTASNGGIFYSTASAGAILSGTATANQVLMSGASTTPAWSTATYPATTSINQLLYSSSANVVAGLATANQAVLTTGTSGIPVLTSIASNGQLIIGSTAGAPAAANITSSDSSVTVTNGSNSISLTVAGGTSVVKTLTGNSGGAISPSSGNINTLGTGSITIVGSGSTLTTELTGLTNHNVLVGAGSATITNVAPSATSGVPLISQGSSSDPAFGTAVVAGGGTGDTSFTAYTPICGGTTSTAALQSVASIGTSGQVLTSNGAGALPTFQAAGSGNLVLIQSQTASSSASIAFTTGITSTYTTYVFVMTNIVPATNNVSFVLTYSTNGGSSYASSGYFGGLVNVAIGSSGTWGATFATSGVSLMTAVASSGQQNTMWFQLSGISATSNSTMKGTTGYIATGPTDEYQITFATFGNAAAINAFKLAMSSGNIASGTITLFGVLE